jgi:anti-sigma regulatory factor (Ser/Thr protein kinase)
MVDDVELVVSELATNAVAHAGTPFLVSVARFGHLVVVEVTDHCPSVPRRVHADLYDTAGRGVSIVERVGSGWGVRSLPGSGKTVWVSFEAR